MNVLRSASIDIFTGLTSIGNLRYLCSLRSLKSFEIFCWLYFVTKLSCFDKHYSSFDIKYMKETSR